MSHRKLVQTEMQIPLNVAQETRANWNANTTSCCTGRHMPDISHRPPFHPWHQSYEVGKGAGVCHTEVLQKEDAGQKEDRAEGRKTGSSIRWRWHTRKFCLVKASRCWEYLVDNGGFVFQVARALARSLYPYVQGWRIHNSGRTPLDVSQADGQHFILWYPKGGDGSRVNNLLPRQNAAKTVLQLHNNIWRGRDSFSAGLPMEKWIDIRSQTTKQETATNNRQTTNLFNKMGR